MQTSMRLSTLFVLSLLQEGSTHDISDALPDKLIAQKVYQDSACNGTVVNVIYYPKDFCYLQAAPIVAKHSCENGMYSLDFFSQDDRTCQGDTTFQAQSPNCHATEVFGASGAHYSAYDCDAVSKADQQMVAISIYNGTGCEEANLLSEMYLPTECYPYKNVNDASVRSVRQTCEDDGQKTRQLVYTSDDCTGEVHDSIEVVAEMALKSFEGAGTCRSTGEMSWKFVGCGGGAAEEDASGAAGKVGSAVLYATALAPALLPLLRE